MAETVVVFLLENIKQLLLYHVDLIGNSKEDFEGLLKDLKLFKAFLRDSAGKHTISHTEQALVDNIREVVEKAEDAIDNFVLEKSIFKEKNIATAISHYAKKGEVAKSIKSVRKEMKDIYEQKEFAEPGSQLNEKPNKGSANKSPYQMIDDGIDEVVGLDEVVKEFKVLLTAKDVPHLDIITITGMPGLGKSTLARKIYNDPEIEYIFVTRAWIYVSQEYSRKEVFLSIWNAITHRTNDPNTTEEMIEGTIRDLLKKQKYLIVMDDVWTKDAWDALKTVFSKSKRGSRILITSRQLEVARHAKTFRKPYKLKTLTPTESWQLLEIKVFGKDKWPKDASKSVGEIIVNKCEGLPLAIVVIAGTLIDNRGSDHWWNEVAKNVESLVMNTEKFAEVVRLSYDHLPYHLKYCFLYLGVFPAHYEIPVLKLIHLWISEGFIEQKGELSLEDIAEGCVRDLVNRNLLMAETRRFDGQIKTCRVHDMLYDFCKNEAEKQNLYQEIKLDDQQTLDMSKKKTLDKNRRVCIHSGVSKYISSKPSASGHVRSFLCFAPTEFILPRNLTSVIPKAFKLLKVLDARCIIFEMFPAALLQLALLRYFAISCKVDSLPSDISKLWNLQTLILLTGEPTLIFPEEMWNMYKLRHIYTNAPAVLPSPPSKAIPGRENLQSLSMISPKSCSEQVLAKTPNIKKLGVEGNLAELFDKHFDNIAKRQHLTDLKLVHDHSSSSEGNILRLPQAYQFPTKLKRLTLSKTELEWVHMNILGNVETLKVLKLKDNAFKGDTWEPTVGGFVSLELLHIEWTNLVVWKASKDHFPKLKHLVLRNCEKLAQVPFGLADIDSFQRLELFHTSPKAYHSAVAIEKQKKEKESQETKTGDAFKLTIQPPLM